MVIGSWFACFQQKKSRRFWWQQRRGHLHSDLGSTDGRYGLKGHYQPLDGGRFWDSSSSMAPWSLLIVPILPRSQVGIDSSMVNWEEIWFRRLKVHVQVEATIASSFNQCTKNLSFPLRVEEEDLACGSRHCVKLSIVIVANVGPKGKRKVRIMEVGACSDKLELNPMVNNSWINAN